MNTKENADSQTPAAIVSGIGMVTPLGLGIEAHALGIRASTPVIGELTLFDPPEGASDLVGEIPEFDIDNYLLSPKAYLDRSSEIMFVALSLALSDAGIEPDVLAGDRTALSLGTSWGSAETLTTFFTDYLERGPRRVKPFIFPHTYANTPISLAALEYRITGPHLSFAGDTTAGLHAVASGIDLIQKGKADIVIAGAMDPLSPLRLQAAAATPGIPQGEAAILFILQRQNKDNSNQPTLTLSTEPDTPTVSAGILSGGILHPESLTGNLAAAGGCMALATSLLMQRGQLAPEYPPLPRITARIVEKNRQSISVTVEIGN